MAYLRNIRTEENHLRNRISQWQRRVDDHKDNQLINPFSEWDGASHRPVLSKDDPNYGRPVAGSITDERGKRADRHVYNEIVELCNIIAQLGEAHPDGTYTITFGQLFSAYTRISDKLVGMLIRARKRDLLDFEGEMLYQRQDEAVVITLFKIPKLE